MGHEAGRGWLLRGLAIRHFDRPHGFSVDEPGPSEVAAAVKLSFHSTLALQNSPFLSTLPAPCPPLLAPRLYPNTRRNFPTSLTSAFLRSSCSHIRITRQPFLRSSRPTSTSRALLRAIFSRQNRARVFGCVACFGHPCQKHPSTNTHSRSRRKTKSGFPNSFCLLRQPVIPCRRNKPINASSVSRLPLPRTRDMTSERLALVKTSGM